MGQVDKLGAEYLVTHLGSHVGSGEDNGIKRFSDALNRISERSKPKAMILLENTAGSGDGIGYRFERFDVAVSRAVAKLNVLSEYCLPFVKIGGLFIAQKGPDIEGEITDAKHAIEMLGGRLKEKIKVPSGYLIVIEKIRPTPKEYPRKAGIPAKKPL